MKRSFDLVQEFDQVLSLVPTKKHRIEYRIRHNRKRKRTINYVDSRVRRLHKQVMKELIIVSRIKQRVRQLQIQLKQREHMLNALQQQHSKLCRQHLDYIDIVHKVCDTWECAQCASNVWTLNTDSTIPCQKSITCH